MGPLTAGLTGTTAGADAGHGNGTTARTNGTAGGNAGTVGRRRGLPSGRAALGGLLVALAAVTVLTAHAGASRPALVRYVVAARALEPGHRLAASDLTTVALPALAAPVADRLFGDPGVLRGAVVVATVAEGELVQASAVVRDAGDAGERQVSLPIETARAAGGRLQAGETVDVVATFGTGADAYSTVVVAGARVVARTASGGAGSLGDRGEVVTLAVRSAAEAVALAHAVAAGAISLVRVTGEPPAAPAGAYRPPGPAEAR